jgi:hypothetical protein
MAGFFRHGEPMADQHTRRVRESGSPEMVPFRIISLAGLPIAALPGR